MPYVVFELDDNTDAVSLDRVDSRHAPERRPRSVQGVGRSSRTRAREEVGDRRRRRGQNAVGRRTRKRVRVPPVGRPDHLKAPGTQLLIKEIV